MDLVYNKFVMQSMNQEGDDDLWKHTAESMFHPRPGKRPLLPSGAAGTRLSTVTAVARAGITATAAAGDETQDHDQRYKQSYKFSHTFHFLSAR